MRIMMFLKTGWWKSNSAHESPPDKQAIGSAGGRAFPIILISGSVLLITIGHYIFRPDHFLVHNVLQRLYYFPIVWAAYRYGIKGGSIVSLVSAVVYLPHIISGWEARPAYQLNQLIELALFVVVGTSAGILFDKRAEHERLLRSYEKMAVFGSLSRSVIRFLKKPLKAMKGMLIILQQNARNDESLRICVDVIDRELAAIDNMRNNLISLVERKRIRLKRYTINQLLDDFIREVQIGLTVRGIRLHTERARADIPANINQTAILNALQQLVGRMIDVHRSDGTLTLYTGSSSDNVWIGASVTDIRLRGYYLSDLSRLASDTFIEYDLISVINTMHNHFGDLRFRWSGRNLLEFILVFPRKLRLPWYLRDEPLAADSSQKPPPESPHVFQAEAS